MPSAFPTGYWISPNFGPGEEPSYKPAPLYWFEVSQTPFAYRTTIDIGPDLKFAAVQARSSGYFYLFVDGAPVFSYAPRERQRHETNTVSKSI